MIDTKATTPRGYRKAVKRIALEEVTGLRYCTSCRRTRPREMVKLYRTTGRTVLPRCDECQAARLKAMRERK